MNRVQGRELTAGRHGVPAGPGLVRARLRSVLDGVLVSRLGLVVAPAGSGKTTLIAGWARAFPGPVAWVRAEPTDAAPGVLVDRIATAIIRASAQVEDATRYPPERATECDVDDVTGLVGDLDGPVLLVIDDLHLLDATDVPVQVERLITNAPPNLYTVLGTRTNPQFNLARVELPTPVLVVGDNLRFRTWEVESLFREVYGEPLRPDDAAALARHTEGWAAALHLFHLSTVGRAQAEQSRAVAALAGRSRYAQGYLSGQVLDGLPDDLRELMRRTCVFDVLTAARCDALLERSDSQRALAELERRQTLTTTDDGGQTYRYHEVLRRHLETALYEELGEARAREWYSRAAQILESEGAVGEEVRARCRGADWPGVQRLLNESARVLAEDAASDWFELLPAWLTGADPWIALAEARRLLEDGQLAAAEQAARRASAQLRDPTGQELCRAIIRTAASWLRGPQGSGRRWADVLRAATQRNPCAAAEAARDLDPSFADFVRGAALLLAGDYQQAQRVLERGAGATDQDPHAALAARLVLAALSALVDSRPEAATALDAVHLEADRRGYTWLARVARGVAVARGGQPADVDVAEGLATDCDQRGDQWGAVLVRAAIVVARLRNGSADLDALDRLVDRTRALDAGVIESWARAIHALCAAFEDGLDASPALGAAESFARSAAVPGALAITYAALAQARPESRAELLTLADSTARAAGLGCRPSGLRIIRPAELLGRPAQVTPRAAPVGVVPGSIGTVEVTCFGGFRLTIGGVEADLSGIRPRARMLLRLLALHAGRPVHRELITDALWADVDVSTAMRNMQVALSALRRTLQPELPPRATQLIDRDGEAYRLRLDGSAQSDLSSFDAALVTAAHARAVSDDDAAAEALGRALNLYTGDLLPEDAAAEWVTDLREHYRMRAADAAGTLAALESGRGQHAAAGAAAVRGIHIDRCHDPAWRSLIRARVALGDLAGAEQARRGYRAVLDSLGVGAEPGRRESSSWARGHVLPRNSTSPIATSLPGAGR
jgi:ATP/maltotriose-dependent transcriptional regulator MalT/DNA-binding SARP family transcriptional activator